MTTAFVTGGSGFVGNHLVARLVRDGDTVRGIARSDASARALEQAGAEAHRGDLGDVDRLAEAMRGCEVVFHVAARTSGGTWAQFRQDNVEGTAHVLEAARRAGVRRLVHVGTEAALMAGDPLVRVDESAPLRPDSAAPYAATKAEAERLVREANGPDLETVVLRPRFVWGAGDTSVLPGIVRTMESGQFAWIGGGHHPTDTTNVLNAVEGLVLAARRGTPGGVYFVTDGEPTDFRDFVTALVATQGVVAPTRSLPYPVALAAARSLEFLWRTLRLKGQPPVDLLSVWVSGQECTIDDSAAREELGYRPVITRDEGLAQLRDERC